MRRNIEKIEIQEPPIEELKKKRSCLKHTCVSGCGCLILFLIGSIIFLQLTSGERVKELKNVPDNWPKSIPVYDKDNISKISILSGQERGQNLEKIALIPKFILSPIFIILEKKFPVEKNNPEGRMEQKTTWESFVKIMKEPVADHRDKIQIEWSNLPAEPYFIFNYYKNALKKENFSINESVDREEIRQFKFNLDQTEGVLYIKDTAENKGTDFASLTLIISSNP